MMQFITAVMVAVAISTSAHASNVSAVGPFDYYAMEETFYHKTALPQVSDLLGTWVWVGFANLPGCHDPAMPKDAYEPNGIKNGDGSLKKLVFSQQEGFVGEYLVATLLNLGKNGRNQGPTNVTYDQDGVTFLKMGYGAVGNAIPLSVSMESITCRSLASNSRRLLCRVRLLVNNLEKYPTYSRFNGYAISYFGLQKQDSPFLNP